MSVNVPAGGAQFQQLAQAFPFLSTLFAQGPPGPYGQNPFYNWYTPSRAPGGLTNFAQMAPAGPGNLVAPPLGPSAPTVFPQGSAPGTPPPGAQAAGNMPTPAPGAPPVPGAPPAVPAAQVSGAVPFTGPPPPAPLYPPPAPPPAPAMAQPTPATPGANTPLTQASLLQLYPWLASYGGTREAGGQDGRGGQFS